MNALAQPSVNLVEDLLSQELGRAEDLGQRLRLIAERFRGRVAATTSFGAQAAVMLHALSEHAPEIPIVFIDTGYLFPETYQYAEQLIHRLKLNLQVYQPKITAARQEALYGKLWEQGTVGLEKYGMINKVEPMNRALRELGADVWVSGLRRAQSRSRAERPFAERQKSTLKLYPIIDWRDEQIETYMRRFDLPSHPLVTSGYVSLGDWHSTVKLQPGMSAEQTRFQGSKRECGLHLPSTNVDYSI